MENQPTVRLTFTCNRNWEDMTAVEGGRFCKDCQKKVVDFTDKTNDEIAAYLISSTTKVCGRFTTSQLVPPPITFWKRWLSAAAIFAAFVGIKEASAQTKALVDTTKNKVNQNKNTQFVLGEAPVIHSLTPNFALKNLTSPIQETTSFGIVEGIPSFPDGEKALNEYLCKNLRNTNGTQGKVITVFVVEKDGSLTDIKVLRGLNKEADEEAIRVLKASPKWNPAYQNNIPVRKAYTMPIIFGQ